MTSQHIEQPKINQRVQIVVKEGPYQGQYNSKITDVSKNEITLMAVYKKEEVIPLRLGLKVKVLYEGKDTYYSFNSEIIKRERRPLPVIGVKKSNNIQRIQRRHYFRLKIKKEIRYKKIREQKDFKAPEKFKTINLVDISGGGILIPADDLERHDKLLIDLKIDDVGLVKGQIVRVDFEKEGHAKTVGVKFIEMTSSTRDKIISFMFDYQRKLRKKGLI